MASGGNHPPTNPAPVSGPGALSKRTDGKQPMMNLPGGNYGDGTDFTQIQAGAPMAQAAPIPSGGVNSPQANTQPVSPLDAPTTMPDQPVTHGAASGPGPGPESLGLNSPVQGNWQNARDVVTSLASNPTSSPAMKWLASRMQGSY